MDSDNSADKFSPLSEARTLSTAEMCEILDIADKTLWRWVDKGCPATRRGTAGFLFNESEVAAWMEATGHTGQAGRPPNEPTDLAEARRRKELALAETYELRLAKERGLLLDAADVKAKWLEQIAAAKSVLIGMPASVSAQLVGMDAAQIQAILETTTRDALNRLSDANMERDTSRGS